MKLRRFAVGGKIPGGLQLTPRRLSRRTALLQTLLLSQGLKQRARPMFVIRSTDER